MRTTKTSAAAYIKRFRQICLALPGTIETEELGHVTFRVGRETFAALESHHGELSIAIRIGHEDAPDQSKASRLLTERHSTRAGWMVLRLRKDIDWEDVKDMVLVAFVSVAPKKMLKALDKTLAI